MPPLRLKKCFFVKNVQRLEKNKRCSPWSSNWTFFCDINLFSRDPFITRSNFLPSSMLCGSICSNIWVSSLGISLLARRLKEKKASKDRRRKRQKCASSSLLFFTPLLRPSAAQEKGSLQNSPWFPYWSQPTPITPFCSLWWWTTRPLLLVMLTNEASGLIKEGKAQTSI